MEALLNKNYKDLFPEEDEQALSLRIQAELDAYEPVSSPLNRTSQSFSKQERSFLEKDEAELSVWQEIKSFQQENEKMFRKFQKNMDNFKEISTKFNKIHEKPEETAEILGELGEFIEKEASFEENTGKSQENQENTGNSELLSRIFAKNVTKSKEIVREVHEDPEIASFSQEFEWLCMEKEDFLSQKLEEFHIKSQFSLVFFEIPLKFPQNTANPAFLPYNFKEKLLFAQNSCRFQQLKPQIPSESTLLPRNSKEICVSELKKLRNPYKPLVFAEKSAKIQRKPEIPSKVREISTKLPETLYIRAKSLKNLVFSSDFLEIFLTNLLNSLETAQFSWKLCDLPAIFKEKLSQNLAFPWHFPHISPVITTNPLTFPELLSKIPSQTGVQGLECRYEGLKSLEKCVNLVNLLSLRVSMNEIREFPDALPSKLVYLDLSQNQLRDFSALKPLKSLRFLNLELNFIEKMAQLDSEALETLNLNKNRVKTLENLARKPNLCALSLYQNEISAVSQAIRLPSLEFLDLGRNKLKEIPSFCAEGAPNLRKLVLYNNEIENFRENVRLLLLNELFLNNNRLQSFGKRCVFPSLERLNLENNRISWKNEEFAQCFCPNLKEINVSYNEIADFRGFCATFRSSSALRELDFRENPFFKGISEETAGDFELCAGKVFGNLHKINGKPLETRVFPRKHGGKSRKLRKSHEKSRNCGFLAQRQEFKLVKALENEKFKQSLFKNSRVFLEKRAFLPLEHLKTVLSSEIAQNNRFFFEKRLFEEKVQRISRFLARVMRRKRAFSAKIAKNLPKLLKIQRKVREFLKKKREKLGNRDFFAVKIQKIVKGFLLRKKKRALFKEIAYKDPELEDLPEISLDFLEKRGEIADFSLKIPDFLHELPIFEENARNPNKKLLPPLESSKKLRNLAEIAENYEENAKNSEVFLESLSNTSRSSAKRVILSKIARNEDKAGKIMAAWGLNKPEIKGTLAIKLEKERKRLENKGKKTLTAEERYAKFLRKAQK